MDKENASGVPRTEIIIRNPRDWVRPTTGFPLGACSSMDRMHDGDKVGDKPKLNPEEMLYKIVDCIMPKLQCADYYTVPRMEELISKEKEEAGFLLPREGLCGRKTWVWKHQVLGRNRCPEA